MPPECRFVSTSSTPGILNFGWISTGMPRPLSRMEIEPSTWIVTSICVQWPARCSSTELSSTSKTQWCSAALIGAADVHARPLAHARETFELVDLGSVVRLVDLDGTLVDVGGSFFRLRCRGFVDRFQKRRPVWPYCSGKREANGGKD